VRVAFRAQGSVNIGGIDFGPDAASEAIPAGTIMAYAGASVPGGWIKAEGQAVSREQYKRLFSALGTTWGAGNGSTTFNVPDLRSRFVVGAGAPGGGLSTRTFGSYGGTESHVLTEAQLPAHTHAGGLQADSVGLDLGAVADGYIPSVTGSTGGGQAHPHIPPYAAPWYMVKI
jgi:hypothetical protein